MKVRVFLADDIRVEKGTDKPLLIGFYADDQIVLRLKASDPDPSRSRVLMMRLAMLFSVAGGELPEGAHDAQFTVTGPDGTSLAKSGGLTVAAQTNPSNIILNLPNFAVVGLGNYKVLLEFPTAKLSHSYEFRVTKSIVPDVSGTSVAESARAKGQGATSTTKKRRPSRKKA